MPENTKTIMSIWSSSKCGSQMGRLTSIRLVSVLMVVCKFGAPIIGRPMHQLLIGSVFIYSWQWQKFTKSIDYVLAFPQADLEVPVYMELPLGFDAPLNGNVDYTFFD
jgi:hypothetical protein